MLHPKQKTFLKLYSDVVLVTQGFVPGTNLNFKTSFVKMPSVDYSSCVKITMLYCRNRGFLADFNDLRTKYNNVVCRYEDKAKIGKKWYT